MGKIATVSALIGAATIFSRLTTADRVCGSTTSSSYLWRVSDARFDGVDPSISNGKAVIAVSGAYLKAHLLHLSALGTCQNKLELCPEGIPILFTYEMTNSKFFSYS